MVIWACSKSVVVGPRRGYKRDLFGSITNRLLICSFIFIEWFLCARFRIGGGGKGKETRKILGFIAWVLYFPLASGRGVIGSWHCMTNRDRGQAHTCLLHLWSTWCLQASFLFPSLNLSGLSSPPLVSYLGSRRGGSWRQQQNDSLGFPISWSHSQNLICLDSEIRLG